MVVLALCHPVQVVRYGTMFQPFPRRRGSLIPSFGHANQPMMARLDSGHLDGTQSTTGLGIEWTLVNWLRLQDVSAKLAGILSAPDEGDEARDVHLE